MKKLILAAALSLLTTTAFAGATVSGKDNPTNSNGSFVGQLSSGATGNGAGIGGNGNTDALGGGYDDTTSPGSRATAVHSYQESGGKPGNSDHSTPDSGGD